MYTLMHDPQGPLRVHPVPDRLHRHRDLLQFRQRTGAAASGPVVHQLHQDGERILQLPGTCEFKEPFNNFAMYLYLTVRRSSRPRRALSRSRSTATLTPHGQVILSRLPMFTRRNAKSTISVSKPRLKNLLFLADQLSPFYYWRDWFHRDPRSGLDGHGHVLREGPLHEERRHNGRSCQ